MHRPARWIPLALLTLALGASAVAVATAGRGGDRAANGKAQSSRPAVYTIPGDAVFPEGIALQRGRHDFFVSSTTDGTIFKGNVRRPALAPFAAGGADGRTTAIGLKSDDHGRLFVAGGGTGKAWVLSTSDGSTIKTLDSGAGSNPTFVNDVALTRRHAYFTDSLRPVILRVARSGATIGELEPWLDLTGTPFVRRGLQRQRDREPRRRAAAHRRAVQHRQAVPDRHRTRAVSQIDLGGATVTNGDGLVAQGGHVYVVRNADEQIADVRLRRNRRSGRIVGTTTSDALMFPTTAARLGNRLLVVNAQFDKRGGTPVLPFTVASIRRP